MIPRHEKILRLFLAVLVLAATLVGCLHPHVPMSSSIGTLPSLNATPDTGTTITLSATTVPGTTTQPIQPSTTQPTQPPTTQPTQPPTTQPTQPPTTQPTQPPTTQPTQPPAILPPKITAKNAFVFDVSSQSFLYNSTAIETSVYPASITKLFTSYVALQYLPLDAAVTVGNELNSVAGDASIAGFRKGDVVTVEGLIYGALLPSGCDASYILAAAAGRVILENPKASASEAVSAFIAACNQQAQQMGMVNTNLVTPDGYHHRNHYFSLQALAMVGTLVLENEVLSTICATASKTITYKNAYGNSCSVTLKNTNKLLLSNTPYYSSYAIGLKTGTTASAGACLLAAYRVGDRCFLVGILGSSNHNNRFADANALFHAYIPLN